MIAGSKWRHVNGDELGQEKSAHSTGLYLLYASLLRQVTSCCINRFQSASRIDRPFCGGEKMTPGVGTTASGTVE